MLLLVQSRSNFYVVILSTIYFKFLILIQLTFFLFFISMYLQLNLKNGDTIDAMKHQSGGGVVAM